MNTGTRMAMGMGTTAAITTVTRNRPAARGNKPRPPCPQAC